MKINLAVLFGGKSVEHEISVISALQAIGNINTDKYEILPVYITKNNELYYGEALKEIDEYKNIPTLLQKCIQVNFMTKDGKTYLVPCVQKRFSKSKPVALVDVAFPIVHGTNVEDGALQGYLKTMNLPFVGCDVLSSAVCMDKYVMKILLQSAGIPVLDGLRFTLTDYKDPAKVIGAVGAKFSYPVIVKPVNLGSSVGIGKAKDEEELESALETAFAFADTILVEPAVVNLREINCAVAGDFEEAIASECEEPFSSEEILSYSDKYLDGSKQSGSKGMASLKRKIPADISAQAKQKIQEISVRAFQFLGCNGVARIDFLMDAETGEIWLNELNTIPGSLAFYLWEPVGLQYADLLEKLISLALKRQRKEEEITYSFDTNILSMGGALGSKGSKGGKV